MMLVDLPESKIRITRPISMPAEAKPWLVYAMGGGWGHLTRSLALARVVARKFPVRIITNSPYASAIVKSAEWKQDAFALIEIIQLNGFGNGVASSSERLALQAEIK